MPSVRASTRHDEAGSFGIAEYRAFLEDLAARKQARKRHYLARLCRDGVTSAALYGFVLGGVLDDYQSGFDPARSGAGKLLLGSVMEDAIQRLGLREFDFLRGEETYKRIWSDGSRRTRTLLAWGPGVRGACNRLSWRLRLQAQRFRAWVSRARRHFARAGAQEAVSRANTNGAMQRKVEPCLANP